MKRLKSILLWAVVLFAAAIVGTVGKELGRELIGRPQIRAASGTTPTEGEVQRQLIEGAEKINQKAPLMLDGETRADGAVVGPGRRLTYLYTIVHYSSQEEGAASSIQTNVKPIVARNFCEKMRALMAAGVTVVFDYRGSDGHELTSFDVNQSTCASLATDGKARAELQARLDKENPGRYKVLTAEEQAKLPPRTTGSLAQQM